MARGDGPTGGGAARLEWVAAGAAALVVLWIVATLAREAVSGARTPPDLAILLEAPVLEDGKRRLRFTLANRGGQAASAVGVALRDANGDEILRRLTVDYVPGRSEATGVFYLGAEDTGLDAVGVVEGYVDP